MPNQNLNMFIELIKIIIPVAAVVITWLLARRGQSADGKKQDNKNLKRLLYQLLELKFQLVKTVGIKEQVDKLINHFLAHPQVMELAPPDELAPLYPLLTTMMTQAVINSIDTENIELRVENIVADMAEIDPVFAYELTGKYKISEKISQIRSLLDLAPAPETPGDEKAKALILDEVLKPVVMDDLLVQLTAHIREIAAKVDKSTLRKVNLTLANKDDYEDVAEMDRIIGKIMTSIMTLKHRLEG